MVQSNTITSSDNSGITSEWITPIHGEPSVPCKPSMSSNALYQRGQFLASVLSPRISSLNGSHSMFANERRRRPSIQFAFSSKKDSEEEVAEPPAKRRRVQRRNSKTAAMLLNSVSSAIMSDLSSDDVEEIN